MIDIIVRALAVYRLSRAIAQEDGPFLIFARVREFSDRYSGDLYWISKGVRCPFCISFWLAFALSPTKPVRALAIAGLVAGILNVENALEAYSRFVDKN